VLARRQLSPRAFELELARPPDFAFVAGQHIRVHWEGRERDYSLVSAPAQATLALCVGQVTGPGVAAALGQLDVGDGVTFSGPHGHFIFKPSARPAVLVATGTGIAPFVAMARAGLRGFTLLQGARDAGDLYYAEELAAAAHTYVACLTRSGSVAAASDPAFFRGRVTEFMRTHLAPGRYDFYLCGGSAMIRNATLLVDERFVGSLVFSETFF